MFHISSPIFKDFVWKAKVFFALTPLSKFVKVFTLQAQVIRTSHCLIYQVESIRNSQGLFFWHFKKNEEVYRRFAREILIADASLAGIKKIGHDFDRAIAKGTVYQFTIHIFFENVYQTLTSLFFPLDFESKKKKQKHWRTTTCFLSK